MRNVLLTGGTRGLGLTIVRQLRSLGYRVIATGRELSPELADVVGDRSGDGEARFAPLDLASDDLHAFVQQVTAEHGELFGLVNNAAIGIDGVLATMHDSQIVEILDVNLKAAVLLTKYATRSMLLAGGGRVVSISSIVAGTGFKGLSVYAASKAGLVGFTRSLARELGGAGITVNVVAPGYMKTDMTSSIDDDQLASIVRRSPMKSLVTTENVAHAVGYLLSDQAGQITGTTLTVDAGSSA
jgi:3-oxoacyl-[acyl-carrier protein] reductase